MLVYPVTIYEKEPGEKYHIVYVSDLDIATQGEDIAECIVMARDLIGNYIIEMEDTGRDVPAPFSGHGEMFAGEDLKVFHDTLVDIDMEAFKRKVSKKVVKKNCTIPGWLAYEAEAEGINFSQVLQEALIEKLR